MSTKPQTAHEAALAGLIPEPERAQHEHRVRSLVARNRLLTLIDELVETLAITRQELAEQTGLNASSLRRMLSSEDANPTTDSAFQLLDALHVRLEAVLPNGDRYSILDQEAADERELVRG